MSDRPADLNIVLVAPEIPHNTGAVGRLCVCLGARLHLIRPLGFALTENRVRRAGMDYWQHVDLTVHDSWEAYLETEQPTQLLFSSTRGMKTCFDCSVRAGCALVFGNESSGLPPELYTRYAEHLYRVPMPGPHARSLNLSLSVSAFAYEAYRQLTGSMPGKYPHVA
ncbi:MAG: tRNA (cytidine(34)-2'-O)-methyltransferase [Kiritimatiellia bacterium]|jgi:tRNA (cytidine/uridine-2'-O-)-methyltransferase|nr:tRNA (cytidine(34)-2'-O)-methyltransferase [Kiritimatiellia bacterium]MDP6630479.1 tRNA (cytidine(34)-2'-O)-methyltransferase [Kiritimatiellia bacterium]MDP6809936.1 tRNA (cytidine(34)-2'-O)-methyltransferase [Kiritimatiellia bacterium]MDP7025026.1 tRNA (cytidine(34)-2'-O)-methyltransferase [Kiritimatiellia bacterium]